MARNTPTIRAGVLILDPTTGGRYREVRPESDAWFRWLESARAFAFEDPSGRFTARKRRRWGTEYWYAFRRTSGRLYETYLGKARDITLGRLRAAAVKLNQRAARRSEGVSELPSGDRPAQAEASTSSSSYASFTALGAPQVRLSQLVRTAAVDRLAHAVEVPLTVASAPAGYGKTALLVQWIATLHVPAAWLTLSEGDNDPVRFWRHVSAALAHMVPGLLKADRQLTEGPEYLRYESTLSARLTALPAASSPAVLILDDYHALRADNPTIHTEVARLVERLPPQVHLVVASRTVPPLPLAQLRARDRLLELGAADLQFSLPETRAFLTRRMKLHLTDDEITLLHARTEGWAAGLQLAALSLREEADPRGWIAAFSGENRNIFDFLVDEVVSRLPSYIYTFALQTGILDRLNSSLCDAVLRSSNSQVMLEELERANVFLVPLDDRREWYRYHPLFADVLRRYLRLTQPNLAPLLYTRATAWCEAHKLPLDAIDYAFGANQLERAARLLERYIPAALKSGHVLVLRDRLERLPDKLVRERPRLSIAHAYTLYLTGERTLVLQRVHDAEEAVTRSARLYSATDLAVMRGEVLALRTTAHILMGTGDPRALITAFQQALAYLPRNHEFRPFITLFVGINQLLDGDVRAASRTLTIHVHASEARGNWFDAGIALLYLGFAMLLQGRLDDALAMCNRAAGRLADYGGHDLEARIRLNMHLIRGKVFYERNDLDQAIEQLIHAVSPRYDPAFIMMEGLPALAYAHLALGHAVAADQALEQSLTEWAESQDENKSVWVWTPRQIRAHQARLWLLGGNVEAASGWARELEHVKAAETASGAAPPTYSREWEEIILARAYLAERRPGDALALLHPLSAAAEADGRIARLLEMLVLQAVAYDAMDDEPAAIQALERVVALGAPQRFVRTFIEGGPPIQRLVSRLQANRTALGVSGRRRREARLRHFVATILDAFVPQKQASSHRHARRPAVAPAAMSTAEPPTPALTPRELEVIRLIAAGASNKDIASNLVIQPSTAKRHVSNILAALDVGSRTQAVLRARELGYLTSGGHSETPPNANL